MAKAESVTVQLELSDNFNERINQLKKIAVNGLDADALEAALRATISDLDYDLHKSLESDEETGEDTYPNVVSAFLNSYKKAALA